MGSVIRVRFPCAPRFLQYNILTPQIDVVGLSKPVVNHRSAISDITRWNVLCGLPRARESHRGVVR